MLCVEIVIYASCIESFTSTKCISTKSELFHTYFASTHNCVVQFNF